MSQTHVGAMKALAKTIGISYESLESKIKSGLKWCYKCKSFRDRSVFPPDSSRYDGKRSVCLVCKPRGDRSLSLKESWKKKKESGFIHPMKGKKFSDEARKNMGAKKGRVSKRKGIPRTEEERRKISDSLRRSPNVKRGKDCHSYKNGAKVRSKDDRRKPEYKEWRKSVFERDKYTCQDCGDKRGGNLRAHHIKSFADHPELRFEVSNGITLCHTCHELRHFKPERTRNVRKLKRGERLWE